MPIDCPITFPQLSNDEMRTIDYTVMGHAFGTHRELGRLCDESVYQHELTGRLRTAGIEAAIEIPVTLSHRQFSVQLALDLVVEQRVISELKTASALSSAHEAQLLEYLFVTNATRGKLINFRRKSVEWRFVNTSLDYAERRGCSFAFAEYRGDDALPLFIRDLVSDWGSGLHPSLYRRAVLACLGSEPEPEQMLQMMSHGQFIGNQRFHLLAADTALAVTTLATPTADIGGEFQKLLAVSPIRKLHWVNIALHEVTLCTITHDEG